jgi:hypothetical protein
MGKDQQNLDSMKSLERLGKDGNMCERECLGRNYWMNVMSISTMDDLDIKLRGVAAWRWVF